MNQADLDLLNRVTSARRRLAELGPGRTRSVHDFDRVAVPASDSEVLRDLLLLERPQVVVEIGLGYGSSALAIAEALVASGSGSPQHLIIDAYQDQFYRAGWEALTTTGLDGICTLVEERSQIVLPRLLSEGFAADAAFVDGSHMFHNVFLDLCYLWEMVRPGGLVVMDDCDWPSVATAARYFEVNLGWERVPISTVTRLRAFRLPDPKPQPQFTDFKAFGR